MRSEGSAFLDRSGRVLAADSSFLACLRLASDDATASLRQRTDADPVLASFLAGQGPDTLEVRAVEGAPVCELTRISSTAGFLLRARSGEAPPASPAELAMQAVVLTRLAGSVAHEVKNPLNAMALQLALLGDKIATASEALATACAANLGSLNNQIGRVNDVVRRFVDVADPQPGVGFDAVTLVADATTLFAHEARRRRIALAFEPAGGAVQAACDPVRTARLLLALLWRAVTGTPEGGRLVVRASASGREAVVLLERTRGPLDPELAWMGDVAASCAAAMGGRLEESTDGDIARTLLAVPRERSP